MTVEVSPERFSELVAEALDGIPPDLSGLMENVAVVVDDHSPPGPLFGIYQGIPLTERVDYGAMALPDRITIYRRTILEVCNSVDEVVSQVRTTVLHEVGHHFGITDQRLDELGWG